MNKLLTLIFISVSFACFGQSPKPVSKIDSVKLNQWEDTQLKNYLQGDKAKEKAQLQERIVFMQRELQLMNEAEQNLLFAPIARENKQGHPIGFRNGYLIIQKP